VSIAVQVLGKVRGHIMVSPDMTDAQAQAELPVREDLKAFMGDKQLVKLIFVPGRLCNLIVK
jgi:leucyl-tRNA synthetase